MTILTRLIAAAALAATGTAALAVPSRSSTTATYRVTYRGDRDVYCIRFFGDARTADPRPVHAGTICHSQSQWARQGVDIRDPLRGYVAGSERKTGQLQ
jgi:hypothetical protein